MEGLEDGHVDEAGGLPVGAALVCDVDTAPLLCGPTMLGMWLHRSGGFQKRNGYIGAFQERFLRSDPHVGNLFYLSFVAQDCDAEYAAPEPKRPKSYRSMLGNTVQHRSALSYTCGKELIDSFDS